MDVLIYPPSLGVKHTLLHETMRNEYLDGYSTDGGAEELYARADGTKGVESYTGLNAFSITYNRALKGSGKLADNLWKFFLERLDNHNEPFYFYNPTECFPPDPTGSETRGRYYVRLRDPNQALSREYFRNCLFSYGIDLIECKEFVRIAPPTLVESIYEFGTLAINCRPGPYYNGVMGELFSVWRGKTDLRRLRVWRTTDYGKTWEGVDIGNEPDLPQTIASYDCCQRGRFLHIATQEAENGRVAYHVFDMRKRQWTVVYEIVVDHADTEKPCVSIENRYPGGEVVVYFQGDRILYGLRWWERGYYSMKVDDEWTEPVKVTEEPHEVEPTGSLPWYWNPYHGSRRCAINRVVSGRENRMHFFYSYFDDLAFFKPTEIARTMHEDLSFSGSVFLTGREQSWLYWPAERNMGGIHVATIQNRTRIMVTRRRDWGEFALHIFLEDEVLLLARRTGRNKSVSYSWFTDNPCAIAAVTGNRLHVLASYGSNIEYLYSDDWGVRWSKPLRASPLYKDTWFWWPRIDLNADVFRLRGKDYIGYFTNAGGSVWSGRWTFVWIRTDKLPWTW